MSYIIKQIALFSTLGLPVFAMEQAVEAEQKRQRAAIDVTSRDVRGNTPLHLAADSGNAPQCAVLLNEGADVNALNNKGETALHLSVRNFDAVIVEPVIDLLMNAGIDSTIRNKQGLMAIDCCFTQRSCYSLMELMLQPLVSSLPNIVNRREKVNAIKALLAERSITFSQNVLETCFGIALARDNFTVAVLIKDLGVDPNTKDYFCALAHPSNKVAWVSLTNLGGDWLKRRGPAKAIDRLTQATPLHLLIKRGLFKEFMIAVYRSRSALTVSCNVVSALVQIPETLLRIFPVISKRLATVKQNEDTLVAIPEFEKVVALFISHEELLFCYAIIALLERADRAFEKMYPETKAEVIALKETIGNELCAELSTHSPEELRRMKRAAYDLQAFNVALILDRMHYELEAQNNENELNFLNTDLDKKTVKVRCSDGKEAALSADFFFISKTVQDLADDVDLDTTIIELPDIEFETLRYIVPYAQLLSQVTSMRTKTQISVKRRKEEGDKLLKSLHNVFDDLSAEELQKLIIAANYLAIDGIIYEATNAYAKQCSIDIIKQHLPRDSDITVKNVLQKEIGRPKRKIRCDACLALLNAISKDMQKIVRSKLHPLAAQALQNAGL